MSKLESVGFKEFTRYLSTLPDHGKGCVICGKSSYRVGTTFPTAVAGESTTVSLALPYASLTPLDEGEKGELMINNSFPILTRECTECGHIVFFSHRTVLDILNKEPPKKGEENE
ncbi:hypothetical protein RZP54_04875 [Raoultella ornithinolytica]|jgi:hypothetical protein|uniref:hypothetical protein n=1 Tax=Raoultella TaxID=160674 RepID=UPI00195074BA|nr:hypothetical protein [Raoultella ornithinolytica]HDT2442411.1 hypothetical protein [Klebsiella pneumoniae subsp. pneumoniae]ELS0896020.1 hypothetical protein [Raoultella ornithinolytica]ELS1887099.1 hypothetical protein [Raoultella ornithinolytica]MBM6478464.1 hypothetical protein [Raoultella ornithinolytica]MCF6684203.1 hypothetical protein [Raoultella ornithinolytica]